MKIITVLNQKGGCAKTSTCLALISGLTAKGFNVLAIDCDPQGNLTYSMGVDRAKKSLEDVFNGKTVKDTVTATNNARCDILASAPRLAAADKTYTELGREYILRNALADIDNYDYAVIDNPPHLGILTTNSLTAADDIIIPTSADVYSLQGIAELSRNIAAIRQYTNKSLNIAGLLVTRWNGRRALSKALAQTLEQYAEQLKTKVFTAKIREGVAVAEAQLQRADILSYDTKSKALQDYSAFVTEYIGDSKE